MFTKQASVYDSNSGALYGVAFFTAPVVSGGTDTITANLEVSTSSAMQVVEVKASGVDQVVLHGPITPGTTTSNGETSTSATTGANGEEVVGMIASTVATDTFTAGSGFTGRTSLNTSNNTTLAAETQTQTSAGSIAGTWTSGSGGEYVAAMITFAPPTNGGPSLPVVQSASNDSGTTTAATVALPGNATAGDWLVVAVATDGQWAQQASLTDSLGDAFTKQASVFDSGGYANDSMAYFTAPITTSGADTITATLPSSTSSAMQVIEVKASGIDRVVLNGPVSGTNNDDAETSTSATTTANGETVLGMITSMTGTDDYIAGTGSTLDQYFQTSNNTRMAIETQTQTTAGSVASTWTSTGWAADYVAAMITLKPAPTSGPSYAYNGAGELTSVTQPTAPSTYVQSISHDSGTTNAPTATLTNPVTAGNSIVVALATDSTDAQTATVTDNLGDTYTRQLNAYDSETGAHDSIAYYTTQAGKTGNLTVTASLAGSVSSAMQVIEVQGSGIDVTHLNGPISPGTSTVDGETSTATTTTNGDTIIGAIVSTTGTDSYTPGTGYAQREYLATSNGSRIALETGTQTTAGSIAATWTSTGWSAPYIAAIIAIKPPTTPAVTNYTYDGDGLRASETTGATSQTFTWDPSGNLPSLLMDSTNAYIYGPTNTPIEQVNLATGTITYLVSDLLGSVRETINTSGTLTGTTSYDAWGNPQTSGGISALTPFGYAGEYTDPTGLTYNIGRYYDPTTGQFLTVDPLVDQTGQPYAYASGNPVNSTDPSGEATSNYTATLSGGGSADPCPSSQTAQEMVFVSSSDGRYIPVVSHKLLHERELYIFNTFLAHGYTPQQAAGVLGNLMVESQYTLAPNVASGSGGVWHCTVDRSESSATARRLRGMTR